MNLKSSLDNFSRTVDMIDEYGILNISRLATWLAPIAVMIFAVDAMINHLGLKAWEALFVAFVLEIMGLGIITNLQQAREYDVYWRELSDDARENHGLIELKMWHYQTMAALYGFTLMVVIIGLKIAPNNPYLSGLAVLAIASVSFTSTTTYMQRRTVNKLWRKIEMIVRAKERVDEILTEQRAAHVEQEALSNMRIEQLQHKVREAEAFLQAAELYGQVQDQMNQLPSEIVAIMNGDETIEKAVRSAPKPEPAPKAKQKKSRKPRFDASQLLEVIDTNIRHLSDAGMTVQSLADQFNTSRPTIYRALGTLKEQGHLPYYEGKANA